MLFFFGAKDRSQRIGKVDISCPQCGRQPCTLSVSTTKATVYFMPVANLKRAYQVSCGHCDNQWNIDTELGERLHRQLRPKDFDPNAKALPNAALGLLQNLRGKLDSKPSTPSQPDPAALTDTQVGAALQTAAADGDIKQVKALLKRGVNVNSRDNGGWTPLMRAADGGHLEVVRLLLEQGADVTSLSKNGFTALMRAFVNGHTRVVDLLRESGAKS